MADAVTEQILSISEAQRELTQLPEQFEQGLETATITRYGKPVMTIVPAETYKKMRETIDALQEQLDGLLETIEILQDEETMSAFRRSMQDIEAGRTVSLDDAMKKLGWE